MESMGNDRRQAEEATPPMFRLREDGAPFDTEQIGNRQVEEQDDFEKPYGRNCISEYERHPEEDEEAKTSEVHRGLGGEQRQERRSETKATLRVNISEAATATTGASL